MMAETAEVDAVARTVASIVPSDGVHAFDGTTTRGHGA
jgi:hypothetical protein